MKADTLRKVFPIISVTAVVFIAVTLLGLTDTVVRSTIEWQKEQKIQRMLYEIFPNMTEHTLEDDIYMIYSDEAKIGFAFLAVGKGYGGNIDILVGLENETTIKGVTIVSHLESPGLGARITESSFRDQFVGVNIADVALRQKGGKIDAITGASISSGAVVDAIRATVMEKIKSLENRE
ncbi:Ion-translocating oxidoreductase complex subunit G [subsurface metagenome]